MGRVLVDIEDDFDAKADAAFKQFCEKTKPEKLVERKTSIVKFIQKMSPHVQQMRKSGYNEEQVADAVRSVTPENMQKNITPKLISQSMTRLYRKKKNGKEEVIRPQLSIAAKVFGTIKEKIGCVKYFICREEQKGDSAPKDVEKFEISTPEDVEKLMPQLKKISKSGDNLYFVGESDKYNFGIYSHKDSAEAKKFQNAHPACLKCKFGGLSVSILRILCKETGQVRKENFRVPLPNFPNFTKEGEGVKISFGGSQVKDVTYTPPPPREKREWAKNSNSGLSQLPA